MTDEFIENYKKYLAKWGLDAQIMMAIEEMSELTKELCKFNRYNTFEKDNYDKISIVQHNIKSEIADVLNTVEQLEEYFGIEEIENIRREKIKRTDKLFMEEN